ncbi:MAG: VOC family protein [Actinomycetes bacterium]
MDGRPSFQLTTVVLGTRDPRALAAFYQHLLGWPLGAVEDQWVTLRRPDAELSLAFQLEEDHTPPVWPAGKDDQQMQVHLDINVDDIDDAVAFAVDAGAALAGYQPQTHVRVLIDPEGHPFCLWAD